jgi:hypothetical protein
MTLDIIKPKQSIPSTSKKDIVGTGITALAAGMVAGTVLDLHSAVECVNSAMGTHFDGNAVQPYAKQLLAELKAFDRLADQLAGEELAVEKIVDRLKEQEDHFTVADLQKMKVEVYGSVENWQKAMTKTEV